MTAGSIHGWRLPLFPLQTVLFPRGQLPLRIFEPRYLDLVRDCLRGNTGFGVVAIKAGREAGPAATPFTIGTYAEIIDWSPGADGFLSIVIEGSKRFRINERTVQPNQLSVAQISWLDEPIRRATTDDEVQLRHLLEKLHEHGRPIDKFRNSAPTSASELAYRLAEFLPLSLAQRYELLSLMDDLDQLELITHEIERVMQAPK